MDFIESFKNQMALDGIVTQDIIIADGALHRFHVDGDSIGSLNGWYILYGDNVPAGAYGCWKRSINKTWCSKSKDTMTHEQWSEHLDRIKAAQEKQVKEKLEVQAKARETSKIIWNNAKLADDNHPYLKKRNIRSHGLRVDSENRLIIPLFDSRKELNSLQFISHDGKKRFLAGGLISGCYFPIGKIKIPTDKVYIGEGYATCETIYQATGYAVACAFNCGNLFAVAKMIKEKLPQAEIIIAADDDIYTDGNPGLTKAKKASIDLHIKCVYPDFSKFDTSSEPTDFNDLMRIAGMLEVKKQLERLPDINDWPEPEAIQSELLPVAPLSIELIPEPFSDFVVDEANRMQCPIDFIAVSILEVVSAIVGAGCGIKPKKEDDWLVIPNVWGCIIGRPGKLKTPAASSAICFLEKLETDEKAIFDEEMRKYEIERESFKAEKDAIKREISTAHTKRVRKDFSIDILDVNNLKNMYGSLQEPEHPKRKRFKSNDATIEKLSELLAENPRGLLLYRDELMGLLTTWDKVGHESDRSFFLEAWNGKGTHTTDRIGRGTIDTGNMCVSVFGTSQPDKLIRYLSGAMRGNNDGLLQRFQLLVYPDDVKWELIDKKPNQQARLRVFNIIKFLADMDFSKYGTGVHDDGRVFFRFDDNAQELFYEWLIDLEKNKLITDDHHLLLEHLSKYRKLMPALALLFHLIDLADGKQPNGISIDNTARACALCEHLEAHARRIYALVTDIDTLAAAILSKKITDGKLKNGFTIREVYRQKGFLKDREIAKSACNELVDLGWLREIETPPAKGQKKKISFLINPKLLGGQNE